MCTDLYDCICRVCTNSWTSSYFWKCRGLWCGGGTPAASLEAHGVRPDPLDAHAQPNANAQDQRRLQHRLHRQHTCCFRFQAPSVIVSCSWLCRNEVLPQHRRLPATGLQSWCLVGHSREASSKHETASLTFVMGCWKIFFGWKPPDCCRCCRASLFSWKRVRGEVLTPDCDSRFVCGMCSSSRRGRIYRGEQVKRVSIRVLRMHANSLTVTVVHEVRRESRRCNLRQT